MLDPLNIGVPRLDIYASLACIRIYNSSYVWPGMKDGEKVFIIV